MWTNINLGEKGLEFEANPRFSFSNIVERDNTRGEGEPRSVFENHLDFFLPSKHVLDRVIDSSVPKQRDSAPKERLQSC